MSVRTLTAAGGKAYQKSHATKLRIFQAAAAVVARVGYPKPAEPEPIGLV